VAPQLDRHDRQETGTGTSGNNITYRIHVQGYPITLAYAWGAINIVPRFPNREVEAKVQRHLNWVTMYIVRHLTRVNSPINN
jgi:hypothetical protein